MAEIEFKEDLPTSLPFPPLTKSHILNCSYHSWHPKYKSFTPKARLIPLPAPFISYLRADRIILPHSSPTPRRPHDWSDADSGVFSETEGEADSDDEDEDPAADWRDTHELIGTTIESLGGKVVPKLNWSAPKDATWISSTNSLECRSQDDIYLLLKSSDFITHDLEHAFDDCIDDKDDPSNEMTINDIPFHLVLRKYFQLNPALEFRCFVRDKQVVGICQRDLNHFEFLSKMRNEFREKILDFFNDKLRDTFPSNSLVFDVYIPPPHTKVWLVDINPWAQRTDPLLFSWLELLTMDLPNTEEVQNTISESKSDEDEEDEDDVEDIPWLPEFRIVTKDDPEAYNFSSSQYGAHKLPRDVVDASRSGEGGLREFADQWKDLMERASSGRELQDDGQEE
jgi:hypothetical protein